MSRAGLTISGVYAIRARARIAKWLPLVVVTTELALIASGALHIQWSCKRWLITKKVFGHRITDREAHLLNDFPIYRQLGVAREAVKAYRGTCQTATCIEPVTMVRARISYWRENFITKSGAGYLRIGDYIVSAAERDPQAQVLIQGFVR